MKIEGKNRPLRIRLSRRFSETAAQAEGFTALLNKPFPMAALHQALSATGIEDTRAA